MVRSKEYLPKYSKSGFLIEFPNGGKRYMVYLLLRGLAFLFDFGIPIIIQYALYMSLNINFAYSALFTFVLFMLFYSITLVVYQGRTPGMWIAKLRAVHKSGFETTATNYYVRSMFTVFYALPLINTITIFISLFLLVITRGFSLVDLLSGTIIITERKFIELILLSSEETGD